MKLVLRDEVLREKMQDAISLLCGTVKTTLGPKGSNVIINKSTFSPYITNDGVTIAESIESDDVVINTILELAKEASVKTNENVGDGTTTTLVLLESIFNNGINLIKEGINPSLLKKELDNALGCVIDKIKSKSRIPKDKDLLNIACVSANDSEIGHHISESFFKVRDKSAIYIKEHNANETIINNIKGYILESSLASNYFLKDLKELNLENPKLLLINNYLNNINDIAIILNEIIINKEDLIIVANDYSELIINDIVSLNMDNELNIILLKNPEYGIRQISILKDIKAISKALMVEKLDNISLNCLGSLINVKITSDNIIMNYVASEEVHLRVEEIKKEAKLIKDDLELQFSKKRLAMFNNGIIEILVGDKTITARREKKMRYDDSLCAIASAKEGILPGSGIVLYEISHELENKEIGEKILKEALKAPFEQIMFNAGLNHQEILKILEENNYGLIYNINTSKYENVFDTEILDSTKVVINSLISSVSIAGMLLTTTSLVINEYSNNINKINDYNEL